MCLVVFFDLYCVYVCIFVIYIELFPYCLFVSNSQVIGCEDRLRNDLYCVGWALNSTQSNPIQPRHLSLFSHSARMPGDEVIGGVVICRRSWSAWFLLRVPVLSAGGVSWDVVITGDSYSVQTYSPPYHRGPGPAGPTRWQSNLLPPFILRVKVNPVLCNKTGYADCQIVDDRHCCHIIIWV